MAIVAQDWGTALAFHLAARRPRRILGLAFMEFIRPVSWETWHRRPEARELFKAMRTPDQGEKLVLEDNVFVERILPGSMLRKLTSEEMAAYRAPFPTPQSRKPILAFPRELPIEGEPADVVAMSRHDHEALRNSTYPKLLFYAEPGALVAPEFAVEFAGGLKNCRAINLGPGAHYLQEDHADAIGAALAPWIGEIAGKRKAA